MTNRAPKVTLQRLHTRAVPPRRMTEGAAGFDVAACLDEGVTLTLEPGARILVPTGWALAIPEGYEGQVRPRSGLALRHGVTVLNAPGTIDSDYRGELRILLVNLGHAPLSIAHGDRVAQLVIAPVCAPTWAEAHILPHPSGTREGGFGSTG